MPKIRHDKHRHNRDNLPLIATPLFFFFLLILRIKALISIIQNTFIKTCSISIMQFYIKTALFVLKQNALLLSSFKQNMLFDRAKHSQRCMLWLLDQKRPARLIKTCAEYYKCSVLFVYSLAKVNINLYVLLQSYRFFSRHKFDYMFILYVFAIES